MNDKTELIKGIEKRYPEILSTVKISGIKTGIEKIEFPSPSLKINGILQNSAVNVALKQGCMMNNMITSSFKDSMAFRATQIFNENLKQFSIGINQIMSASVQSTINMVASISQHYTKQIADILKKNSELFDNMRFMQIADEIGFPVYLEVSSDLKYALLDSYRNNDNKCNMEEMYGIIVDYYNDDYVESIFQGIKNAGIFKARLNLIAEGFYVYKHGCYAAAGTVFATQMSGMILDVYNELSSYHHYTKAQKQELIALFEQKCKPDSEKGMLLQIVCEQENGIMMWYRVAEYFLNVTYSSKEIHMETQPMRHKICHGEQVNFNTKEMNLKMIMCMDIIAELGYRVEEMKEQQVVSVQ